MNEGIVYHPECEVEVEGGQMSDTWLAETKRMFLRGFAKFERRHPEMHRPAGFRDKAHAEAAECAHRRRHA